MPWLRPIFGGGGSRAGNRDGHFSPSGGDGLSTTFGPFWHGIAVMADWYRVPVWCHGRDRREEAAVALYVLGEWHVGRSPSPLEVKAEFGWGWSRAAKFIDTLWEWAGEANAVRPALARAASKTAKLATGEESGSDRGAIGESAGSDRGVSRARSSLERDEDGKRSGALTCSSGPIEVLPLKWATLLEPTTTTPAPVAAVEPPKVKRTRATKAPTTDTHAREAIAAWCDAYSTGTGQPYTITAGDAGRLKRVAADYLTGEAWPEKLATLATGMATYIAAPDRWPKGPPTVGGFCIDPQRWIAQKPANTTPAPMALHNPY